MVKLPEPGNSGPVFPAGTYKVRVLKHEHTVAKSSGNKQIQWKAQIIEPEEHKGRPISSFTTLTPAAIWKVSNLIAACGVKFDPNSIDTDSQAFLFLCDLCKERTAYWFNAEDTDQNGNPRNNVAKFEVDKDQDEIEFQAALDNADDSPFKEEPMTDVAWEE